MDWLLFILLCHTFQRKYKNLNSSKLTINKWGKLRFQNAIFKKCQKNCDALMGGTRLEKMYKVGVAYKWHHAYFDICLHHHIVPFLYFQNHHKVYDSLSFMACRHSVKSLSLMLDIAFVEKSFMSRFETLLNNIPFLINCYSEYAGCLRAYVKIQHFFSILNVYLALTSNEIIQVFVNEYIFIIV